MGCIIWQSAAIEGSTFLPLESKIDFLTRDPGGLWKCPGSTHTKPLSVGSSPVHIFLMSDVSTKLYHSTLKNFFFTYALLENSLTLELDLLINIKNS